MGQDGALVNNELADRIYLNACKFYYQTLVLKRADNGFLLKICLQQKPHIDDKFNYAIKLLRSADEHVTCEESNACDKVDMNMGKRNTAM
jgi:hypothetical protein